MLASPGFWEASRKMFESVKALARSSILVVRQFWKTWSQPHRRAALWVAVKAATLMGALTELGWQLDRHFFSRAFPQLPISLAWSMLTVIFIVTGAQTVCSVALKIWDAKRARLAEAASHRLTTLIAGYLADGTPYGDVKKAAADSPKYFEACVAMTLLRLRGAKLQRLRQLPEAVRLRDKWMAESRKGDESKRRQALEQLGMLRDPAAIPSLENALEDSSAGVVVSAVRGLLLLPAYEKRLDLLRSLQDRPLLVRVLTAREAGFSEAPSIEVEALRLMELSASVTGDFTEEAASADARRAACSSLAALGDSGRDLLRRMSAAGEMGDAPAEALGDLLVAMARGGSA